MHILVVDDDVGTLNALKAFLVSAGHEVDIARDPRRALLELENSEKRTAPIDLIVTDLRMPEMSGLDFIHSVRKRRPDFPVILMTAYGDDSTRWRTLNLRACRYLTKPFSPEQLSTKIDELWMNRITSCAASRN